MGKMRKAMLAVLTAVMVVIASACQTIGGVDVDKALLNTLDVKSSEGSMAVSWNIDAEEGIASLLGIEDETMLKVLKTGSIKLDFKNQDELTASAAGELTVGERNIPFAMYTSNEAIDVEIEGMPGLIRIPVDGEDLALSFAGQQDMAKQLAALFVKHLPNPEGITAKAGTITQNNQQVAVTKIEAKIGIDKVPDLLITFFDSLAGDEEGMKAFAQLMSGAALPVPGNTEEVEEDLDVELMKASLGELKTAIEQIKPLLMFVNHEKSFVDFSLAVDSSLNLRQMTGGISLVIDNALLPSVSASITMTSDTWNINGSVTADKAPEDADLANLDDFDSMRSFIGSLDTSSDLYLLLKEDLKLTEIKKTLYVYRGKDLKNEPFLDAYTRDGWTLVSARWLADSMGYDVEWDPKEKKATLFDDEREFELYLGKKEAYLDGETYPMAVAAEITQGRLYVPLRDLCNLLGVEIVSVVSQDGQFIVDLLRE